MNRPSREDMVIISIGIETLLECVQQTETWWRIHEDAAALRRTQLLVKAILATRRKFFTDDDSDSQTAQALIVAEGLREAALQCREGQAALHARLVGGAETIERLCRFREVRP